MVALVKDIQFGVHSVALLNRSAGFLPYTDGIFEIVGNVNFNSGKELVSLLGGSNPYPFAVEEGASSAEISMTVRQMNRALLENALAAITTAINSSTTGSIGTLYNSYGSSVKVATTGIASVSILSGSEANIKSGIYLVKAISSTTVNIYATTNLEFLRGTDVEFQDGDGKLLASNLTITTGGNTDVSSLGIRLTGGSGTIGFTTGDVAIFEIAKPHSGIKDYSIGAVGQTNPYVGMMITSAAQADGTITSLLLPKVKLGGMPLNFTEKAFGEFEITGTAVRATNPFNSAEEIVAKARQLTGAN